MRLLHTFSNWKWTGPAEPAVRLAARLADRHELVFACGRCPYDDLENRVQDEARAAGLELADDLVLRKHFGFVSAARDLRRLTSLVHDREFDVVHAHLLNDHVLVGAAARRAGRGVVIRTVYGGRDLGPPLRRRIAFGRWTDGVIAASDAAAEAVRRRTGLPDERLFVVPGAVDVGRFSAAALAQRRSEARLDLGLSPDDVAFGIVARVQRHRRYELLVEAFARVAASDERVVLVVIGRGTHFDELIEEPVRRLGLESRVRLAGYREGDAYDTILAALDAGIFLVPGSDGSCRAARELVACGLPMVVTKRAPLPEIVRDGVTGHVVDEQVASLADAMTALASDPEARRAMGVAARTRAEDRFSLDRQATRVEEIYEGVSRLGRRRG